MADQVGVKHDGGKPWAGTVLAGFWRQGVDDLFALECARNGMVAEDIAEVGSALSYLFDTDLALSERLVKASEYLIAHANPAAYLPHVIDVGTYGAKKPEYGPDNWLHVDDGVKRYYEAAGRHVRDVVMGDWRDAESGCVNLGHICWGILAGSELVRRLSLALGGKVAVDFETVSTEPGATQPPAVTIRVGDAWRDVDGCVRRIAEVRDESVLVQYTTRYGETSGPFDLSIRYAEYASSMYWGEKLAPEGETKPALELPLVIGKRYRLFLRREEQGVYEAEDFSNEEKSCLINDWAFYVETGVAPGCESLLRLEGPVES